MNVNTYIECGCINGSVGVVPTQMVGTIGLADTKIVGLVDVVDTQILGSVGIICTPNTGVYLRVTPDVVWFTSDNYAEFDILSNTRWEIE